MTDKTYKAIRKILEWSDKHSEQMFMQFKREFTEELPKHKSSDEYFNRLSSRTDVSQDDKWEIECLEGVVDAVYILEAP